MKDFDALRAQRESRDRTFKIAGRTFRYRPATRPEEVAELFDWLDGFTPMLPQLDALAVLDRAMVVLLEPDCRDDWQAARADTDEPITQNEILEILAEILEVQTGRPILQLAASSGSASGNGTSSTGGSGSPAAPASPTLISAGS